MWMEWVDGKNSKSRQILIKNEKKITDNQLLKWYTFWNRNKFRHEWNRQRLFIWDQFQIVDIFGMLYKFWKDGLRGEEDERDGRGLYNHKWWWWWCASRGKTIASESPCWLSVLRPHLARAVSAMWKRQDERSIWASASFLPPRQPLQHTHTDAPHQAHFTLSRN